MEVRYPLFINKIASSDKIFNLIQDSYLPAGTKQRGLSFFQKLKEIGVNEVVTYGTVYGYGQVATAWCCKVVGLLCTIFLPRTVPRTHMTRLAIKFGADIINIQPDNGYPTITVLSTKARNYCNKEKDRHLLELGLDDDNFIKALSAGISQVSHDINPKRIWVAAGSGVLARALARSFPDTQICMVQVGRKISPDILENINHVLYVSPEAFRQYAEIPPPYKSLKNYDAKIWRFVRKYGEDGDYIWNVK